MGWLARLAKLCNMCTMSPYERKTCRYLVVIIDALTEWERTFVLDCLRYHFHRPLTDNQLLKLAEIADQYLPDRYLHMEPSSTPDPHPGESVREDCLAQWERGRSTERLGPELSRIVDLQMRRGWSKATP